jgi:hypothetical protein
LADVTTARRLSISLLAALVIFVPAGLLAIVPLIFTYIGFDALGGRLGLWVGDPTTNDGEEYWAWPFGLIMLAVLLGAVALLLYLLRSRVGLARWVWPLGLFIMAGIGVATMSGLLAPIWRWRR